MIRFHKKTHFIFHFLTLLEPEIMIFMVDGKPVKQTKTGRLEIWAQLFKTNDVVSLTFR